MVQFDSALSILVPAAEVYPDDASLTTVLTNTYIAAGKEQEASEAFKAAAEKNPSNKDYQYDYGVILLKQNNFQSAIDQFRKTLTLDSLYWNAVYNLGATYVNWGVQTQSSAPQNSDPDSLHKVVSAKFVQAIPYLKKYSTYKNDDPNLWELLAKVNAFNGNTSEAQEDIQRADSLRQVH